MKKTILVLIIIFSSNVIFGQTYQEIKSAYEKAGSPKSSSPYKPTTATLLSLAFPGVGQIYAGETTRGIGFILGTLASSVVTVFSLSPQYINISCDASGCIKTSEPKSKELAVFGIVSAVALTIWSTLDANKVAHVKNYYKSKINTDSPNENIENIFEDEEERKQKLEKIKQDLMNSTSFSPIIIQNQNTIIPGIGINIAF